MFEDRGLTAVDEGHSETTNAARIRKLRQPEMIRLRPAMYIGTTDVHGLHQLIYTVVGISVQKVLHDSADKVDVVICADCTVMVSDSGRGILVDNIQKEGESSLGLDMRVLHADGEFESESYRISSGLYGLGISVVKALSTWMLIEVRHDNELYTQEYEKGVPTSPVRVVGSEPAAQGTIIYFKADPKIFETTDYQYNTLVERFRELCYPIHGLKIHLADERAGQEGETLFHFEDGICSLLRDQNRDYTAHHPLFYVEDTMQGNVVEVALQYTDRPTQLVLTFVNAWKMVDGGTPLAGFYAALTRTLNTYARKNNSFPLATDRLLAADVRRGLTAIINVRVINPHYNSSMLNNLSNREVQGQVQQVVGKALTQFLDANPDNARKIIERCLANAQARVLARGRRQGLHPQQPQKQAH